jgi:hypothetical protein
MKPDGRVRVLTSRMGVMGGLTAQSSTRTESDPDSGWADRRVGKRERRVNSRSTDRREIYLDNRGYAHGTSNWTRGSQRSELPASDEMRSIRSHAESMNQHMDELMDELMAEFMGGLNRDRRPHFSPSCRGISTIAALRGAAREFLTLIDSDMTRPERTVPGFEKLKDSHERFETAAARRELDNRTERHLVRLRETMNSLDRLYQRYRRQPAIEPGEFQQQALEAERR